MMRRSASSNPGSARKALRAARSAGCSQARDEMAVSLVDMAESGVSERKRGFYPCGPPGVRCRSSGNRRFSLSARCVPFRGWQPVKRLFEIRPEILGILDTAGQPYEAICDSEFGAVIGGHGGM